MSSSIANISIFIFFINHNFFHLPYGVLGFWGFVVVVVVVVVDVDVDVDVVVIVVVVVLVVVVD